MTARALLLVAGLSGARAACDGPATLCAKAGYCYSFGPEWLHENSTTFSVTTAQECYDACHDFSSTSDGYRAAEMGYETDGSLYCRCKLGIYASCEEPLSSAVAIEDLTSDLLTNVPGGMYWDYNAFPSSSPGGDYWMCYTGINADGDGDVDLSVYVGNGGTYDDTNCGVYSYSYDYCDGLIEPLVDCACDTYGDCDIFNQDDDGDGGDDGCGDDGGSDDYALQGTCDSFANFPGFIDACTTPNPYDLCDAHFDAYLECVFESMANAFYELNCDLTCLPDAGDDGGCGSSTVDAAPAARRLAGAAAAAAAALLVL